MGGEAEYAGKSLHNYRNFTLALGFSPDFSEESEPIDELGDNPGALAVGTAFPQSEVDDAELPGRARETTGWVAPCILRDAAFSDSSLEELVFS